MDAGALPLIESPGIARLRETLPICRQDNNTHAVSMRRDSLHLLSPAIVLNGLS